MAIGKTRTHRAAVDTGALLAIASTRDQHHQRALAIEERFRHSGGRWIGTTLVLGELHGYLLHRVGRVVARRVLAGLLADPAFEWRDASVELVQAALRDWIDRFDGQRFSMTDAVTFALMKQERIERAFAFDRDFVTVGFELME